jgi:hypothetical protein
MRRPSSASVTSARVTRSPGLVIKKGEEGGACSTEGSLKRKALGGDPDWRASDRGPQISLSLGAALWAAAASAKPGKCDSGGAPEVGSLESPIAFFDP